MAVMQRLCSGEQKQQWRLVVQRIVTTGPYEPRSIQTYVCIMVLIVAIFDELRMRDALLMSVIVLISQTALGRRCLVD